MSGTADYIDEVLGATGYLAKKFSGYMPRPGQIALARAVDAAIRDGEHIMAEGPTGTGKSIGYATPATYHAAQSGKRVVIATANIALQEQLVRKDLPLLAEVLPWGFTFALLKGKNNFLCLDRFYEAESKGELDLFDDPADVDLQRAIVDWARATNTGDVSELPFEPPPRLWRRFSVSADDCKGSDCHFYDECHAARARAAAAEANVVVTNYHLLFAHLQVREATGEDLVLPPFDIAILDEAHKAADIARDFFGFRVTAGGVRWVGRLLSKTGDTKLADKLTSEADRFFERLLALRRSPSYKTRLRQPHPVPWSELHGALHEVARGYTAASEEAADTDERAELRRALRRAETLAEQIEAAMTLADSGAVYFIDEDTKGRATLCAKPIEVADRLRRTLFGATHSVTVTSATLSTGGSFNFIASELGVPEPRAIIADSPFRWEEQALLIVPEGMPEPNDPSFPASVASTFSEIIDLARGRTLGLFTSYRNLNATYQRVAGNGHRVLKQGDMPRTALIEEFRRDVGSVLLGTESFWAGVDVPGESLSCVVIDRLPFPTPDDPVLDAITQRDRRWFTNYSVPRAVIAFKQGFGRLIRTVTDRGVVVVLDRRLVTKPYGRLFTDSLPNVLKSRRLDSIRRFLEAA
ncbi:MAG: DEAD/DEAH box helicase family protein [Deltaproteobacteria bacterium]|nr:DEAD/DEAH box helicase family protein [Deltaproteobacteria bacterium]